MELEKLGYKTGFIHPTAIIHPDAVIGEGISVGPFSVIGKDVQIEDGCVIGPHVVIEGPTKLGRENIIKFGVALGTEPQHVNYKGERTALIIGQKNVIREHATISRGTQAGRHETVIGNENFIMTAVHIAHDVLIGDNVVITHASGIGGHVVIEDRAVIGGLAGIHQYTRIGSMAMVGAQSLVKHDVPPFFLVSGNPARPCGINKVGMRRNGMHSDIYSKIKMAYKLIYRENKSLNDALTQLEKNEADCVEINHIINFIRGGTRGICR